MNRTIMALFGTMFLLVGLLLAVYLTRGSSSHTAKEGTGQTTPDQQEDATADKPEATRSREAGGANGTGNGSRDSTGNRNRSSGGQIGEDPSGSRPDAGEDSQNETGDGNGASLREKIEAARRLLNSGNASARRRAIKRLGRLLENPDYSPGSHSGLRRALVRTAGSDEDPELRSLAHKQLINSRGWTGDYGKRLQSLVAEKNEKVRKQALQRYQMELSKGSTGPESGARFRMDRRDSIQHTFRTLQEENNRTTESIRRLLLDRTEKLLNLVSRELNRTNDRARRTRLRTRKKQLQKRKRLIREMDPETK